MGFNTEVVCDLINSRFLDRALNIPYPFFTELKGESEAIESKFCSYCPGPGIEFFSYLKRGAFDYMPFPGFFSLECRVFI